MAASAAGVRWGTGPPDSSAMRASRASHRGGQILAPLAQRGMKISMTLEPVVQILPETPRLHGRGQVVVRGADDAHIHGFFLGGAQRPHAALLDGAQQLGLHGQGQVANFVQKQRATLRRLKVPWRSCVAPV